MSDEQTHLGKARFDLTSADEQSWSSAGYLLVMFGVWSLVPGTQRHPDILPVEWKLPVAFVLGVLGLLALLKRASFEDQLDVDVDAREFRCVRIRPTPERVLETVGFDDISELAQARTSPSRSDPGARKTFGVVLLTNTGRTLKLPCGSHAESDELTRKLGLLIGRDVRDEEGLLTVAASRQNGTWRFQKLTEFRKQQRSFSVSGVLMIVVTLLLAVGVFFMVSPS